MGPDHFPFQLNLTQRGSPDAPNFMMSDSHKNRAICWTLTPVEGDVKFHSNVGTPRAYAHVKPPSFLYPSCTVGFAGKIKVPLNYWLRNIEKYKMTFLTPSLRT